MHSDDWTIIAADVISLANLAVVIMSEWFPYNHLLNLLTISGVHYGTGRVCMPLLFSHPFLRFLFPLAFGPNIDEFEY